MFLIRAGLPQRAGGAGPDSEQCGC